MFELGTREKPVRVTCDLTTNYRYIYVKIDYTQQELIETLENNEYGRLARNLYVEKGTNLAYGEVRLRFSSKSRSLAGCDVTCVVRPGAFRHGRGRSTLDLYATDLKVVQRPWWTWCIG